MQITGVYLIASTSLAVGGAMVSSRTCKRERAGSEVPQLTWLVCNVMGYVGLLHNDSWKLNEWLMVTQHFEDVKCNLLPKVAFWGGK